MLYVRVKFLSLTKRTPYYCTYVRNTHTAQIHPHTQPFKNSPNSQNKHFSLSYQEFLSSDLLPNVNRMNCRVSPFLEVLLSTPPVDDNHRATLTPVLIFFFFFFSTFRFFSLWGVTSISCRGKRFSLYSYFLHKNQMKETKNSQAYTVGTHGCV